MIATLVPGTLAIVAGTTWSRSVLSWRSRCEMTASGERISPREPGCADYRTGWRRSTAGSSSTVLPAAVPGCRWRSRTMGSFDEAPLDVVAADRMGYRADAAPVRMRRQPVAARAGRVAGDQGRSGECARRRRGGRERFWALPAIAAVHRDHSRAGLRPVLGGRAKRGASRRATARSVSELRSSRHRRYLAHERADRRRRRGQTLGPRRITSQSDRACRCPSQSGAGGDPGDLDQLRC